MKKLLKLTIPEVDQYIWHISLNTGDTRQSWRHEIDQTLMPRIAQLLDAALDDDARDPTPAEMDEHPLGTPIPRIALPIPGYYLSATGDGRCLLASVSASDETLLVTFGVAAHARCGAGLWRVLTEMPKLINPAPTRPQAPWCAARLQPGLVIYPSAAYWLGDLERCIAWAWLDRVTKS
jgi:hypothetical protein